MFGKQAFRYKFDTVKENCKVKHYFKEVKVFHFEIQTYFLFFRIFLYTKICQNRYRQNVQCEQFISGRGYSVQILHPSRADLGSERALFCMLESNTKSIHVATSKLTFWGRIILKSTAFKDDSHAMCRQADFLSVPPDFLLQPDFQFRCLAGCNPPLHVIHLPNKT